MTSDFNNFKTKYGKSYENDHEESLRLSVYVSNMKEINEHNAKEGNTYTRGENVFADFTAEEFKNRFLMKVAPKKSE